MTKTYELQLNNVQKEKLEKILKLIEDDGDIELKEIKQKVGKFPKNGPYYYLNTKGEIRASNQYYNETYMQRYA